MSACAGPTRVSTHPKTVIVADDTAFVRDRFRVALESTGHAASTVSTGPELLARVRRNEPVDLVVLDLRLPKAHGVAVVRALGRIDGFQAPIVVFSGTIANAEEVRELGALGAALEPLRGPGRCVVIEVPHGIRILPGHRFARNARRLPMLGALHNHEVLVRTGGQVVVDLVVTNECSARPSPPPAAARECAGGDRAGSCCSSRRRCHPSSSWRGWRSRSGTT